MANPNNITLRSEKGSFLTFEEMDLNLTELQNLINEYESFVGSTYSNHVTDFNSLQTAYDQYVIDTNNRLDINEQDIVDINNDQTVQDNRIAQNESDILGLQLGGGLTYKGNWSGLESYSVGDVITYNDGLDYISVSNSNSVEPVSGTKTNYWIVLNAKSIAEFIVYNNVASGLAATDVQSAIDELQSNVEGVASRSISDFSSPDYIVKSAAFTAVAGGWYSLDASTAFTITLPDTPSTGDTIEFMLVAGDASENNLTILRNGSTIESLAEDMVVDSNYPRGFKMYFNGTTWRVTA